MTQIMEKDAKKSGENVINVLVVDDHPMVRQGIIDFLEIHSDLKVKGTAKNGEEAIAQVEQLQPDVVLMDLMMPGMDGIEAIRQIKSSRRETKIIVLTSFFQDDKVFPAIKAGADGYLLKDVLPNDLVSAIRQVYSGKSVLHPDIAQKLMHNFSGRNRSGAGEELTPRENEVLELIAAGLSNEEIANKLIISDKTVKTHVSNILHKLNLSHRIQAALYVLNRTTPKYGN
jgi:NarL family two-component system response regulator LiaR